MLVKLLTKVFGSRNERKLSELKKTLTAINRLEADFASLKDTELSNVTRRLKQRVLDGETLEALLSESFALVREASKRVLGLRPFDAQLLGGMVLNARAIAEMRTGEGKTLTATLPAYLNALLGKGVHIVTVNEYLAQRDAEDHKPLFEILGMRVGVILRHQTTEQKRQAYLADITYGTNSEFGFDYLRDNMVSRLEHKVQRELYYALIDEVDSILIDEARTPLIISGPTKSHTDLYKKLDELILTLVPQEDEDSETGDYFVNFKLRQVSLTEKGLTKAENWLNKRNLLKQSKELYQLRGSSLMHCLQACLRAHALYKRDVDYVVRHGELIIVDEHTGRTAPGRRWSDGLHQAIEAKEHLEVHSESQTLASISYQNYFRLYKKLAGMTGTADTEAYEFKHIYQLDTVVIPTNRPMIRIDQEDLLYLTHEAKLQAVVESIMQSVAAAQPVLVGTISIEKSEALSEKLREKGIKHSVLNAKFHEQEAEIIAQAGWPGMVTIATNMAGRGTDIVLGGCLKAELKAYAAKAPLTEEKKAQITRAWQARHDAVVASGGLRVIGTERHESRRIDNQLRGRSGRQGDPGSSQFFLSLEDALIKLFCTSAMANRLTRWHLDDASEAITHPWITRSIASAQKRVESRNFDLRKHLLEYDDVANEHRKVVYRCRDAILNSEDLSEVIRSAQAEAVESFIADLLRVQPQMLPRDVEIASYLKRLNFAIRERFRFDIEGQLENLDESVVRSKAELQPILEKEIKLGLNSPFQTIPQAARQRAMQAATLKTLDELWKEHLLNMEYLKQSTDLYAYAERDPKKVYQKEAFKQFQRLFAQFNENVTDSLSAFMAALISGANGLLAMPLNDEAEFSINDEEDSDNEANSFEPRVFSVLPTQLERRPMPIVPSFSRNALCPCGSKKRYKLCHGAVGKEVP